MGSTLIAKGTYSDFYVTPSMFSSHILAFSSKYLLLLSCSQHLVKIDGTAVRYLVRQLEEYMVACKI